MSGEKIRLAGDAFVVRAFASLAQLPAALPNHALVGGLAVMVRLQQAHRVTGDIDLVSTDEPRAIELLIDDDATRTRNGVHLPSGVDLDLIDAADPALEFDSASDEVERDAIARQLAFSHALRAATVVDVTASARGLEPTQTEIQVATTSDLVALKLHAIVDPSRHSLKRGSDVYDLVQLLIRHGTASIGQRVAMVPQTLRTSIIRHARAVLIDDADRSAAMVRGSSVRGVEVVGADQLEMLGLALVGAIGDSDNG